jgi:hypothetical protein
VVAVSALGAVGDYNGAPSKQIDRISPVRSGNWFSSVVVPSVGDPMLHLCAHYAVVSSQRVNFNLHDNHAISNVES